jgi:RND family efflux transporter MFP subunit
MIRLLLPLVLAIVFVGCSGEPKGNAEVQAATASRPEPVIVKAVPAETRTVQRTISVTGSLHPDETVSLSSEAAGRLAAVFVDFGQTVRKGQVVAELDKSELELQLERSRASLAQALARIGLDPNQLDQTPTSTPAIRQAEAQAEDAKSKYENAARLVKTGDIAQERHTELEKTYRSRQAAVEAARDELRTQLANIQALRAEMRLAQKRLGDAQVRAPFDGMVSQKLVSPGQYLKENTPILEVVKTHPMRLRLDVPETAAGVVRPGTTLHFTTDAVAGVEFEAKVRELNPALNEKSRTLTAEARILKADARLKPGMFVQVRLITQPRAQVVAVPQSAVYAVAGLHKLFVVRDGKAVEQRITPGQELNGWVEVTNTDLRAGEQVAVSALGALSTGSPVKVEAGKS